MTEATAELDPLIGKTLRSYRIQELMAVGRWGNIYRAFQSSMNRTVTVRVLTPEMVALPGKSEQFLEKSRAEAQLVHPHLLIIYEAGRADGVNFCAMEYMDGPSLRQFLQKGNEVDEQRLLQTVVAVARALHFLWQRQVPHQPPLEKHVLTMTDGTIKLTNIEPVEAPASQSQHEDLLKLGLMVAGLANDISPVSRPVGRFVERMLGAAGREPFSSLAEAADAAEGLQRKLFKPSRRSKSTVETLHPSRAIVLTLMAIGLLALLSGAVIGWFWWHTLSH